MLHTWQTILEYIGYLCLTAALESITTAIALCFIFSIFENITGSTDSLVRQAVTLFTFMLTFVLMIVLDGSAIPPDAVVLLNVTPLSYFWF